MGHNSTSTIDELEHIRRLLRFVGRSSVDGINYSCLSRNRKGTRGSKTPEHLIGGGPDRLVVEIGGKSKGREQFKGINAGRKLVFAHTDTSDRGRIGADPAVPGRVSDVIHFEL